MELSTWRSIAGDVDVARAIAGPGASLSFERLAERATSATIDGIAVLVADLDDVIASKRSLDRPTDRDALPELVALAVRLNREQNRNSRTTEMLRRERFREDPGGPDLGL